MRDDCLVRLLLRLYPAEVRERWGEEMRAAYRAQREARRRAGRAALAAVSVRTVIGMARGAVAEWRARPRTDVGMGGGMMGTAEAWTRELGQAARRLRRVPGFTVMAVATLGLGTGAFGAVVTVVDSVLWEPMPYEKPEELAWVWRDYPWMNAPRLLLGSHDIEYLAEQPGVEAVVVTGSFRTTLASVDGDGARPRAVRVVTASPAFLEALDVRPLLGRGFRPADGDPAAPAVVLLRYDLWRDAFGADPGIIGRRVALGGKTAEVVGVLPPRFDFLRHETVGEPIRGDLYAAFQTSLDAQPPGAAWLGGLVRLRGGPGSPEGRAALERVEERLQAELLPAGDERRLRLRATPLREDLVGDLRAPLTGVLAAAGFLLLVLGANLATLCISRSAVRERDLAVRAAIGGSRRAVAGSVLAEAVLVALAGAAGGLVAAWAGADALARVAAGTLPRAADIALDGSGVAVTVGLAVALALLAAVPPILRARATDPGRALREAAGPGESSRRSLSRDVLVVVQVAFSLLLLVGGGLLGRSFAELLRVDPGFDPTGTLTFRVGLDGAGYEDTDRLAIERRLRARLRALPGVDAVGVVSDLPLGRQTYQTRPTFLDAPGNTGDPDADHPLLDLFFVTPGYLRAAGFRLLEGRDFREGETSVALIDDVVAARFYPDGSAVGSRIPFGHDTATIVGVIDQPRFHDIRADDRGQLYQPNATVALAGLHVAVRMESGDPLTLVPAVRAVVAELDPGLAVSEARTLEAIVDGALREERLNLGLVTAFALAALLLSALGVYGVVANAVVRRRPEIGVRMALGAEAGGVASMVLSQGLRLVLAGVALGLAGAWAASRFAASLLFTVQPHDPLTFGAAAALLIGVGALASWLPARRATHVDPAEVLRET